MLFPNLFVRTKLSRLDAALVIGTRRAQSQTTFYSGN